ncbi:hypothetical protein HDU82_003107 [Entophlyctis luteolus]|nr:hypothetical protein HDU82_003107 [Entophlyctis luteolus]
MDRNIWYQLVDESGNNLADVGVDIVSVSTGAMVVNFRDAVWGKNKDDVLSGVSAARLKIFEKRDNVRDPAKQPLKAGSSIGDGFDNEDAPLFVVVPKKSSATAIPLTTEALENALLSALKRANEDESSSSARKSITGSSTASRESNVPFRERIIARDGSYCVVCQEDRGDSCHIVPHHHWKAHPEQWAPGSLYYTSCFDPLLAVNDVRNGLFLCKNHHEKFDIRPTWTITFESGRYFYTEFSLEKGLIRGHDLFFGNDASIRPHPVFLEYQCQKFSKYNKISTAGHSTYSKEDSQTTLEQYCEEIQKLEDKLRHDELDMMEVQREHFMNLDNDEKQWLKEPM